MTARMRRLGPPRTWWQDDAARHARELTAMLEAAPDLEWTSNLPGGGWQGPVPLWPFDRPRPTSLNSSGLRPLEIRISCGHAFPMVAPAVHPVSVDPPLIALGWTDWHVAPDGSLCLLQESSQWDPSVTASELVPKISGWYLEYRLLEAKLIEAMTTSGIVVDGRSDALLAALGEGP